MSISRKLKIWTQRLFQSELRASFEDARCNRRSSLETFEQRKLLSASPIWVGGVYVEEDMGSDLHSDTFYITFRGGAEGTQLKRIVIDGDQGLPGLDRGDMFFDTKPGGFGSDESHDFTIVQLVTANPNARVRAFVEDGSTMLILEFENFEAGDLLVFTIDVDEVEKGFTPGSTDYAEQNKYIDPIASGVEFQGSKLYAEFTAPHYEDIQGIATFLDAYDALVNPSGLRLPRDDEGGFRDRTAGTAVSLQQIPKPIWLEGIVYEDFNQNLVMDPEDVGLANVKLELWRKEGEQYVSTGHSTFTDSQGRYSFGLNLKLPPGTYQVRQTQPEGYFSVGATPGFVDGRPTGQIVVGNKDILTEIEIPKGDQYATKLNFAEARYASIEGKVCVAKPGKDCFSTNPADFEPLANVKVELFNSAGTLVATATTNADGSYLFDNLIAGSYTVVEHTPSHLLEGSAKTGRINGIAGGRVLDSNRIDQIVLVSGSQAVDYDFCEILPASLSGHVYEDSNDDGIRQTGERLLGGVLIELIDANGNRVAQTRTDDNGFYKFTFLPPGTYKLKETTPEGFVDGKDRAGTIGGVVVGQVDSAADTISRIVLPSGMDGIDYDFGELREGELEGIVIADTNGNCILDAEGDHPIPNVLVQLLDGNGHVIKETRTDANGRYRFTGLLPGTYAIREIQPEGYFQGNHRAGTGGGDASVQDLISSIVLLSGDTFQDYNFCEIPPATISGLVYVDTNGDAFFQPTEKRLAGVRIELIDSTGQVIQTTNTADDGTYIFRQLPPGSYSLREIQPAGYFHGGQKAGSHGGDDSIDDLISSILIPAGKNLVDYDFRELEPASIAGKVFNDIDGDCTHDPDEPPIAGVLIHLLDQNGNIVQSTFTGADGRYEFVNLRPGVYGIREIQPDGFFQGGQKAPESLQADLSVRDQITNVRLGSGQVATDLDFCERPPAMISGYVFQDGGTILTEDGLPPDKLRPIRDGSKKSTDKPIAGVTLQLRLLTGAPVPSSAALPGFYSEEFIQVTTDANGYFEFAGLQGGVYHIFQIQPDGFEDGLDTPGTKGGISVNQEDIENDTLAQQFVLQLMSNGADPRNDAILMIDLDYGQHSMFNNFSEIVVGKLPEPEKPKPEDPQGPVTPGNPPGFQPQQGTAIVSPPFERAVSFPVPVIAPPPSLLAGGVDQPYTWHLSVINSGRPRGDRADRVVSQNRIARSTQILDITHWSVVGLKQGRWTVISTTPKVRNTIKESFSFPNAKTLVGDFNGDGHDSLALFYEGEWLIDVNGNGQWDAGDLWVRLGKKGDIPIVGDWDGDGKDDIGIYGPAWAEDEELVRMETGLPDPENQRLTSPKNMPPDISESEDVERLMQLSSHGQGRADIIDHVFKFGRKKDIPVVGDFNGDGISTIGIFNNGRWTLDVNGDGKLDDRDLIYNFGQEGDLPVVGDFNGDGIDEIGIIRGSRVIVDTNNNGRIDATDMVFELDDLDGEVIIGDFDGDGKDEPAVLQSNNEVPLQARWAG